MQNEIWKEIFDHYEVSNFGKLRSKITQKLIKFETSKKGGYLLTKVYINGKRTRIGVHRIVAMAFLPNPNNYPQVNHKDENTTNNCVDNLEWCTNKYNANYGSSSEKRRRRMSGENNPFYGKKHTETAKQKMSVSRKTYINSHPDFKEKMSSIAKERFSEKNIWVTNDLEEKRISEKELNIYLEKGWHRGKKHNPKISESLKKYFSKNPEKKYWGANARRK